MSNTGHMGWQSPAYTHSGTPHFSNYAYSDEPETITCPGCGDTISSDEQYCAACRRECECSECGAMQWAGGLVHTAGMRLCKACCDE